MNRIKNILWASALLALATQAQALSTPWGTIPGTGVTHKTGDGGSLTQGDSFSDTYTFTLVGAGANSEGSVSSVDFSDLSWVTSLDGSFTLAGGAYSQTYSFGGVSGYTPTALNFGSLSAGAYTLTVAGTATGADGGLYSFGMNFTPLATAPVPEPETLAMMLSGLGLLAVAGRRRQVRG